MTRSITIVNTSNWEHEDYKVTVHGTPYHLKPGSSIEVTPATANSIQVEEAEPKPAQPFYVPTSVARHTREGVSGVTRDDKQVFPKVVVTFE